MGSDHAGVTQLAECLLPKQNVESSNLFARSSDGPGNCLGRFAFGDPPRACQPMANHSRPTELRPLCAQAALPRCTARPIRQMLGAATCGPTARPTP